LLNSGSTAKALTGYGQGLASQGYNNYLSQLDSQFGQGLTAAEQIGQAGTAGGMQAGKNMQTAQRRWQAECACASRSDKCSL
jgi:hypothetical protein